MRVLLHMRMVLDQKDVFLQNHTTAAILSCKQDNEFDFKMATCRRKLQNRRSKLNHEINKELRLRSGAENLFKATTNRKLRETVALELSFVDSNLQLLREQLIELNSSVELYQSTNSLFSMPMIPLGLKETKEVDLREPFHDFILEHYSECVEDYEDAISEFLRIRQQMRCPTRDFDGVTLLFQYYNHLYFVERRFFAADRFLGIYFEWFDSLTGMPSCQRTVALEKASVLFNAAAVYTQIAAKQDRTSTQQIDVAIDCFLRAAGVFKCIAETFTNGPSTDLQPATLEMLSQLMIVQARECWFEKNRKEDFESAQEAAYLSECYGCVAQIIEKDGIPSSWVSLVQVKREYFNGLAHFIVTNRLLPVDLSLLPAVVKEYEQIFHTTLDKKDYKVTAKRYLQESLLIYEECQRLHRMCRVLKGKGVLFEMIERAHAKVLEKQQSLQGNSDYCDEELDTPVIPACSKCQLGLIAPDYGQYRVQDLFRQLGPLAVFSAKKEWSAPRLVQLRKYRSKASSTFGFSIRGDAPVMVAAVETKSLADSAGLKDGDFIVAVGDRDVKWSTHDQVVKLMKQAGDCLNLKVVTPAANTNYKRKLF